MYTLLTSFNEKYWQTIAKDNVRQMDEFWPGAQNILLYHQLTDIDKTFSDRVKWLDLYHHCPDLLSFAEKWKDDLRANGASGKKNSFRWNAIKFCHKTFSIWHAAKQQSNGWLIWLDCDAIIFKNLDKDFFQKVCPQEKAISYLGRKGKYSECGFVAYNLSHPDTRKFLLDWENLYTSGEFINLPETHDSWTFDYIRKTMDKPEIFLDLNKDSTTDKNPFHNSILGQYIAHAKGDKKEWTINKLKKKFKL